MGPPRRIFRTDNNWETTPAVITPTEWANEPPGQAGYAPLVLDPSDPYSLYAGTNFLYRWNEPGAGTDLGQVQDHWSKHLGGHPLSSPDGYITAIAVAPTNGNVIYAGSTGGQLWMSSDRGNTWRRIDLVGTTQGLPQGGITSIAVHPAKWRDVLVATGADLYRCQDTSLQVPSRTLMFTHGRLLSWAKMTTRTVVFRAALNQTGLIELPNFPISSVVRDPASPDEQWIVSTDMGVFFTDDGGSGWQTWPGLPNAPISELKIVPASFGPYLYAASFGRGIWRRSLD